MNRSLLALAMLAGIVGCSKIESPTSVPMDEILKLRIMGPTSIRADGASTTTVQATIPKEAASRSVKFAVTQGTFQNTGGKNEITVIADDQGMATATIIAGTSVALSNVTASSGTVVVSTTLMQDRAFAQTLGVETSSAIVALNGTRNATITALLNRQAGSVSLGTPATFEAFRQGQHVGRFFAIGTSDATGRVSATFSADTITEAGPIQIVVTTQTDSGAILRAELTLTAN